MLRVLEYRTSRVTVIDHIEILKINLSLSLKEAERAMIYCYIFLIENCQFSSLMELALGGVIYSLEMDRVEVLFENITRDFIRNLQAESLVNLRSLNNCLFKYESSLGSSFANSSVKIPLLFEALKNN